MLFFSYNQKFIFFVFLRSLDPYCCFIGVRDAPSLPPVSKSKLFAICLLDAIKVFSKPSDHFILLLMGSICFRHHTWLFGIVPVTQRSSGNVVGDFLRSFSISSAIFRYFDLVWVLVDSKVWVFSITGISIMNASLISLFLIVYNWALHNFFSTYWNIVFSLDLSLLAFHF